MKSKIFLVILILCVVATASAQRGEPVFTRQDTLRGSITPERVWWDLTYYHLDIDVDIENRSIEGQNTVNYRVVEPSQIMQIDLQPPMEIKKVVQGRGNLKFKKDGNAWFIELKEKQKKDDVNSITVYYEGKPKESRRPPWDGGWSWRKDAAGNPWIATANQGDGASLWWPCKDHPYDEPDSMLISVNVPGHLMDVSNGRLRSVKNEKNGTKTYHWFVSNPINGYGVNVNIADYVHFSDVYEGEKGPLTCDYYVLKENLEKAKVHFKQAHQMLEAFEHWFGPYPFYEDGYKLVGVPYPGMEHQSSVTYGNGYKNGFGGRDVSGSGWGDKFDFIIIHESGHEWFANSVTNHDEADMWIHESFIAYSENLFVDYFWGKEACSAYLMGTRQNIRNDRPIIGKYHVNYPGSGDMYAKGANMLHTLRQLIEDDELWRSILRGLNREFYHQTVTAEQITGYISEKTGKNLDAFFNQYLRDTRVPIIEYIIKDHEIRFRYTNVVRDFDMPVRAMINGENQWIFPSNRMKTLKFDLPVESFVVDPDFYVASFNLTGGGIKERGN